MENNVKIIMYGAEWCADCFRAKKVFTENKIDYTYIDIDKNEEAKSYVKEINPQGNETIPVIKFPDNSVLIEPSTSDLTNYLITLGMI